MSQEEKAYLANASHPSLGDAEVAGKLFSTEFALKFESQGGAVELPYDGMDIAFGTKQDPRVTFTNASAPDCVLTASNEDILRELAFRRNRHLRPQVEARREQIEGVRRLVLTGTFFAVFVSLSAALGAAVEWIMPRLVDRVPVKFEKELGDEEAGNVRRRMRVSGETNVTAQLNAMVARLTKSLPKHEYEFRVTLLASGEPNAFALPGGNIFVNMGLLRLCTNSVEVAGVLAHEISHVTRRHGLRKIVSTIGPARAMQTVLGNNHGFLSTLASGSHVLVGQTFSRDFEREADEGGYELMAAANLDPRGLENGLRRIQKFEQKFGGGDGPRALMSHPPTPERVDRLAARWGTSAKKSGFTALPPLPLPPAEKGGSPLDKLFE
ncbi:MAG: M48 family metallopeptidase [Verrucomicrobia bacterium]|nr:M48 family metallopeptidase [Verrucomicrobiota bacterium]